MAQEKIQNGPEPAEAAGGDPQTDTAGKSLADALRLSFRLLTLILIFVLAALLLTGLSQVQPDERGVRLLFGRIQGDVLDEGLRWSWPEPVGRVLKVPTGQNTMEIDDFWYNETASSELGSPQGTSAGLGLLPGWDGALLTGDRALVHVKFTCNYRFGVRGDSPASQSIRQYLSNTGNGEEFVRAAVCNAAIRTGATYTVDAILTAGQEQFLDAVQRLAQSRLDEMQSGIQLTSIQIANVKPPLAAIPAFDAVNSASQGKDRLINEARGESNKTLEAAAGPSWETLVGDFETPGQKPGLLTRYAKAREDNDEKTADELLQEINQVLMSEQTKGEAKQIIYEARRYKDTVEQRVKARAETFQQLVDKFEETPELMLERLWAQTKEEILNSPMITKFYIRPGKRDILIIGPDPDIRRRQLEEAVKAKREEQMRR